MNFKEVLLVVNPISGDSNKKYIINTTQEKVKEQGANFHLFTTTGTNDIEKIRQRIAENNIERVLVAGGDGTINLVAEAIKDMDISMGIIPAGSANGLAVNLQLPENVEDQVNIALGDKSIKMDLVCLNDIICLHISDLGINAELIKNYDESSIRGKMGYLIQSIPTLIKSNYPFHFNIRTPEGTKETEGILLGIANAQKYGTGANVNPGGKVTDGKFEILIFKKFSFSEILKTLRNETDFDPEVIEIFSTDEAVITCKKPVAFQIDGEYIGESTEVKVNILPQKLQILVPENFIE
ncbi:diacylglycerol/lipid kinase family protein [Christiangramia aquimixticola]|uniref:diacylglycerol/lipid kinase family protein n=1 Tax=Christiangramia aquimixticola TaxID=1697558 RepID=UPI003AA907C9